MKRLVKRLFLLAVLAVLGMGAYRYLGDFEMGYERESAHSVNAGPQRESGENAEENTEKDSGQTKTESFLERKADESEQILLDVQYICQKPDYPTGCESVSAVMLLNASGVSMDVDTFIDSYLTKGSLQNDGGRTHGPHPQEAFIGDPRGRGFGCYAPVIASALEQAAPGFEVIDETGKTLPELADTYIRRGVPVVVWATINMAETKPGASWTIDSTGETFVWKQGEHCLVLIGFDREHYYMADPYTGEAVTVYEKSLAEARYEELGRQAVTILRKPQAEP